MSVQVYEGDGIDRTDPGLWYHCWYRGYDLNSERLWHDRIDDRGSYHFSKHRSDARTLTHAQWLAFEANMQRLSGVVKEYGCEPVLGLH